MPAEGLEPPTNGLQNRCSTTELSRHRAGDYFERRIVPVRAASEHGRLGGLHHDTGHRSAPARLASWQGRGW